MWAGTLVTHYQIVGTEVSVSARHDHQVRHYQVINAKHRPILKPAISAPNCLYSTWYPALRPKLITACIIWDPHIGAFTVLMLFWWSPRLTLKNKLTILIQTKPCRDTPNNLFYPTDCFYLYYFFFIRRISVWNRQTQTGMKHKNQCATD